MPESHDACAFHCSNDYSMQILVRIGRIVKPPLNINTKVSMQYILKNKILVLWFENYNHIAVVLTCPFAHERD